MAIFFKFAHLPNVAGQQPPGRGAGSLKYPHTVLGMIAIFMYVGGDVSVASAVINYLGLPKLGGLSHQAASKFLAYYYGGLMIGRLMGFFALSDMKKGRRRGIVLLVPVLALAIVACFPNIVAALGRLPVFNGFFDPSAIASTNAVCGWGNVSHFALLLAVAGAAFLLSEARPDRHAGPFQPGHYRPAGGGDAGGGGNGQMVHSGGGIVRVYHVVEHFRAGHRRVGAAQEPGGLLAHDWSHGGRRVAAAPGIGGGQTGNPVLIHRAFRRLRLYRLLWPLRLPCRQKWRLPGLRPKRDGQASGINPRGNESLNEQPDEQP